METEWLRPFSLAAVLIFTAHVSIAATNAPVPTYHIYAGNTHAHTVYTWSHGEQFPNAKSGAGETKEPGTSITPEGVQSPGKSKVPKPDWQKFQGPPSAHLH